MIENKLIKMGKFIFSVNFVVLDIDEHRDVQLILGQSFISTSQALTDFETGKLILLVNDKQKKFLTYAIIKMKFGELMKT